MSRICCLPFPHDHSINILAEIITTTTMKTFVATFLVASASAFAPATPSVRPATALNVDLANGAMSFDRVCREWRCKYEGDKATSESLEAISKVVDECLPELKKASKDATVNRLVCGSCLDFKVRICLPLWWWSLTFVVSTNLSMLTTLYLFLAPSFVTSLIVSLNISS